MTRQGGAKRQRTSQRRQTNGNGGGDFGVTTQHDARKVYQRPKYNKAKAKQFRNFSRKIERVQLQKEGTTSVVYNTGFTEATLADEQSQYGIVLYGGYGLNAGGRSFNHDIERLVSINRTAGVGINTTNRKLYFRSAVLDVTARNSGTTAMELDFYEFYIKKSTESFISLEQLIDAKVANNTEIFEQNAAAANAIARITLGATPFQYPAVMEYVTILKKNKVFLPSGAITTYQIRLPRSRWYDVNSSGTDSINDPFGIKGWTRGLWIVQKGVPTALVRAEGTALSWSITRTYCMKTVDEDHVDLSGASVT